MECPLVARACRCAGPRFDPDGVRDALTGIRLPDLDPDQPYCVRFVGARVGHGQGSRVGPGEVCQAPSACELAQVPEADLRVCSISDVVTLSRSETPILVDQTTCQACPPGPPALCGNLFRIPSCAGFGE
ncbi:MAG TPA: hypothetical protein RMF84_09315 [Polyangiaceae bacterium LLY-WYZ-14_1]|nr:hypothetical protein [Polyangiaceae bacterium LLY-WYZ-14_1]